MTSCQWLAARAAAVSRRTPGDTVSIVVQRDGGPVTTRVVMRGHDRPVVRIEPVEDASPRQRRLREAWLAGR